MARRLSTVVLAAALLALGTCTGASKASAATAHPRIFLDAPTLARLDARARGNDGAWSKLRGRCDQYDANAVEYPDGQDYPDNGGIGEGYQGDGYYPALLDAGLCYQVAKAVDPARAAHYAAVGAAVLAHMSDTDHEPPLLRDDGYGVRFFAGGMAVGYDWLYDALSPELRGQVTDAIQRWLAAYEKGGFEHEFPQGNYYAGYYAAKAYAGMALSGDSATGDQILADWRGRVQGGQVQPYYAANLSGGGWPEGWNYGPLGSVNMSLPALAAKTALGVDLVHDKSHPYTYPLTNAKALIYSTWPSLKTLDDAEKVYNDDNPTSTQPWDFTTEAGLLAAFHDPFAPYATSFASAIRRVQPGGDLGRDWDLWENMLFADPKAPQRSYTKLPRSYYGKGLELGAVRSDWSTHAVWGLFKSGPYINNPDNGEEFFGKGSLAIVNGSKPFLVNASGAVSRNTPGTNDGSSYESTVMDDLFYGNPASRDIFNVFYVSKTEGQSNRLRREGAHTAISAFHDGGSYVTMTGTHLADMYEHGVRSWTRQIVYVRPGVFVVSDKTAVPSAGTDQWMAFHFSGTPTAVKGGKGGAKRYDVSGRAGYVGSVDSVLPKGHHETVVGVLGGTKVKRLEIHGAHRASQQWLTVFDAASSAKRAAKPSPLKAKGEAAGVLLRGHGRSEAVLLGGHNAARVSYRLPKGRTLNVVSGLKPGATYAVRAAHGKVSLRRGKGKRADSTGTLAFTSR